uniref:Synapse differentiation inducing 1 n=1 Tax=Laticauda laticaudata TaxID=8630 RepID=A0A8C5RGL2_LATLA
MDGLVKQKGVLKKHNKAIDTKKKNGLINTRNLMAENREGLVSVYPTAQYQGRPVGTLYSPNDPIQQLLDPSTLPQTVESRFHPNIILYSESMLRSWGESLSAECCETTFIEDESPTKGCLDYPEGKFVNLSTDEIKIQTLSYDIEEEEDDDDDDDFQELEVREHYLNNQIMPTHRNGLLTWINHCYFLPFHFLCCHRCNGIIQLVPEQKERGSMYKNDSYFAWLT